MSIEAEALLQEAKESIEAAQNYRSELQQRLHGLSQARKQVSLSISVLTLLWVSVHIVSKLLHNMTQCQPVYDVLWLFRVGFYTDEIINFTIHDIVSH